MLKVLVLYLKNNDSFILNAGSGNQFFGDIRVDKYRGTANIITDIEVGLPFRENIFEIVYSRFLFEHLRNPSFVSPRWLESLFPEEN